MGSWAPGRRASPQAETADSQHACVSVRCRVSSWLWNPPARCPLDVAETGKPRGLGSLCLPGSPGSTCQKTHCKVPGMCGKEAFL